MNNEKELNKIKKATSGFFKKSARATVANALLDMKDKINNAKQLNEDECEDALKTLMNEATALRHESLKTGANSYGHSQWAAAAACESWLLELIKGTPASIERVESIIDELSMRR